jgi:hypothetical protein
MARRSGARPCCYAWKARSSSRALVLQRSRARVPRRIEDARSERDFELSTC